MPKRKIYTVEYEQDGKWLSILIATYVPLQYARGYLARESENYPCRHLRIVDEDGVTIEGLKPNGRVHAN